MIRKGNNAVIVKKSKEIMKFNAPVMTSVCLTMALLASPAFALSQNAVDDDWDYGENTEHDTVAASVSYSSGQFLLAHCANNRFMLAIAGLPEQEGQGYSATVSTDTRNIIQTWEKMGGVPRLSADPARDARLLRNGGTLAFTTPQTGQIPAVSVPLELPSQHANLDKVLAQCGYELADDRDHLERVDPAMTLVGMRDGFTLTHTPSSSIELTCIVTDGRLQACRRHRVLPGMPASRVDTKAAEWNGKRVQPQYAADNEGRVAHIYIPILRVVRQ